MKAQFIEDDILARDNDKYKEKLVVVIMGQNCEKFIKMSLDSVKDADAIVYCDGGSADETLEIVGMDSSRHIIKNKFDQEDKTMNGKQRNFYLNYVKENFPDWWCLVIDADEIVEDLSKIKSMIQLGKKGLYSLKMRHLIGDLGHEDSTVEEHFVLNRLFYIQAADKYPEVEHSVLVPKEEYKETFWAKPTTIWHLAYIPNMWDIKKRYDNHVKKSNIHTPEFLRQWYKAHLFGRYPKKPFNPVELPKQLLNEFGIDKDELYFEQRGNLQMNHVMDAIHWSEYFKPNSATICGCGFGQRVFMLNKLGVDAVGVELSQYAVDHAMDEEVHQGNIVNSRDLYISELVVAYDLLEHISYKDLDKAIENLINSTTKHILISVPVLGDPNLEADPTHIIKEDKEWWIKQFADKGLKLIETPNHFLYKDQIMIFKKEQK